MRELQPTISLREYAAREHITIFGAYRRVREGRVRAEKMYGVWRVPVETCSEEHNKQEGK